MKESYRHLDDTLGNKLDRRVLLVRWNLVTCLDLLQGLALSWITGTVSETAHAHGNVSRDVDKENNV